jgi:tRNA-dihydrouridine synthase C
MQNKKFTCPPLFLAPMEGVGDVSFRKAMASIGGFDWACTEFIRVSTKPHIPSLLKEYCSRDTAPIPQAAQVMGVDPELMAEVTRGLALKGAPRVDLNCGCPSNTVTGKGAGSSMLKTPEALHKTLKAMVNAVDIPVTAKLRSGFTDTTLFKENLLAAEEAGIAFLALHPRTKVEGYGPPARWDLIRDAKEILKIPVIGNGDVVRVQDCLKMVEETKCDGVMIGRGAIANPWIFQEIRAHYKQLEYRREPNHMGKYLKKFIMHMPDKMPARTRVNKLKQLMNFMTKGTLKRLPILRGSYADEKEFLDRVLPYLDESP